MKTINYLPEQLGETRFKSATPDRCYRNLILPIDVKHPTNIEQYRQNLIGNKETILNEKENLDPIFCSWLDSLDLEIEVMRLFTNPKNLQYTHHVDRTNINDQSVVLNFPFEDHGTEYSWYNLKQNGYVMKKPNGNGVPVYYFNPLLCEEVLRKELVHPFNQPVLINTGYIHTVKVSDTNRYCFSYFLRKKRRSILRKKRQSLTLQWDEAIQVFAPYIQ